MEAKHVDAMLIAGAEVLKTTITSQAIIGGRLKYCSIEMPTPLSSFSNLRWSKFVRARG